MLFRDTHAFQEVPLPGAAAQGMALSSGRVPSWARPARRGRAEPDAPSGRRLGAQLPRCCGAGRARASAAEQMAPAGGRPFGVRSTFLRAYVADGREGRTTSSPLRRPVASPVS